MNAYFSMSTGNPTGLRPFDFIAQANPQGLGRLGYRRPRLRGLGAVGYLGVNVISALPASAQAQITQIIQSLQQAQANINNTNALIQQNTAAVQAGTSTTDMSDIAQINSANQQQLTTLISEFTAGYQAFTGMVPPGLSGLRGLGQVDPVSWTTIAGAIVAIGVIAAASYALIQQTSANYATAQARLTAAQSSSTLLQQAAAAYSSGDTATGDSLTAAAAAGSSSGFDINSFLTNNWAWLAGGALVLFLGPSLIKKL